MSKQESEPRPPAWMVPPKEPAPEEVGKIHDVWHLYPEKVLDLGGDIFKQCAAYGVAVCLSEIKRTRLCGISLSSYRDRDKKPHIEFVALEDDLAFEYDLKEAILEAIEFAHPDGPQLFRQLVAEIEAELK